MQPAYFNDGETAGRYTVDCAVNDETLTIKGDSLSSVKYWPLSDVRFAGSKRVFRLVGSEARLTLVDGDDGDWLTRHCRNLLESDRDTPGAWRKWAIAAVVACFSLVGLFTVLLPQLASAITSAIPLTLEKRIGEESRDQVLSILRRAPGTEGRNCRLPEAMTILQAQADKIAAQMQSPFPISLSVVPLDVPNAFAMPGGQVVLLSGLIDEAENADEVIGVLAHEIAHVANRDAMRVSIEQTGTALLVSLLVGDVFGGAFMTGVASSILETGYSREAERAADMLAVTTLNELGMTARPFADFLERITEESGASAMVPEFLSTHPDGAQRAQDVRNLSSENGRAMTSFDWRTVRRICEN